MLKTQDRRTKIGINLCRRKNLSRKGNFSEAIGKDSSVRKTEWETCAGKGSTIFIMYSFLGKVQACVSKLSAAFAPNIEVVSARIE